MQNAQVQSIIKELCGFLYFFGVRMPKLSNTLLFQAHLVSVSLILIMQY